MEEEKTMSLPPSSEEWLSLLKKLQKEELFEDPDKGWIFLLEELPEQNNLESCQYKLKVYETIMSVPEDYLGTFEHLQHYYLQKVSHRDEFVTAIEYLLDDLLNQR